MQVAYYLSNYSQIFKFLLYRYPPLVPINMIRLQKLASSANSIYWHQIIHSICYEVLSTRSDNLQQGYLI